MDQRIVSFLFRILVLQWFIIRNVNSIQKREWIDTSVAKLTEGDVSCLSEYMEMGIHSARIDGLGVWLSETLQIQANFASLDHLNLQLSACGFSLHKEPDSNFIFRVSYSGCFVQQQHGFHVLTLNLVTRINRFGGRPHSFTMKCPVVSAPPNREQIQCDPEFIQVTRRVPYDNWNNELHWSLSLSDHLIVALEDASLIQISTDMRGPDITVQGRRREVMNPAKVMENEGEFLALKLVSGQYAYSLEATCPKVTASAAEETVLHIFKRRMGLTKRGSYDHEALTVSHVSVNQTDDFTVQETSEFVTLIIPTARILQTRVCADSKQLLQPFYRVDVLLTFRETNHKMHWTMENTLPCTVRPAASHITSSSGPHTAALPTLSFKHEKSTTKQPPSESSTLPAGKLNQRAPFREVTAEFSTTDSPHMQMEARSSNLHTDEMSQSGKVFSGFDGNTITSINATETSFHDFVNVTTNTSAELVFLESSATAEPLETSFFTTEERQQSNTTSGKEEQQKQRRKWVWKD